MKISKKDSKKLALLICSLMNRLYIMENTKNENPEWLARYEAYKGAKKDLLDFAFNGADSITDCF